MIREEGQAPFVEIVKTAPVQKSDVLKEALREHLRAHIDPLFHHSARWRIDFKGERVKHNLGEVVIVAVSVDQLLEVVKDLEFDQESFDALVARREDSEPRDQLSNHGLAHTLLREESLS